jgi:hypothetical protein
MQVLHRSIASMLEPPSLEMRALHPKVSAQSLNKKKQYQTALYTSYSGNTPALVHRYPNIENTQTDTNHV